MALFKAVCVVELPALRPPSSAASLSPAAAAAAAARGGKAAVQPRFVVILPHGDAAALPRSVLEFCFPDLDQLASRPYHYDHAVEEFVFTLTPKDEPHVHGERRGRAAPLQPARQPARANDSPLPSIPPPARPLSSRARPQASAAATASAAPPCRAASTLRRTRAPTWRTRRPRQPTSASAS